MVPGVPARASHDYVRHGGSGPHVWTKTADQTLESVANYCGDQRLTTLVRVRTRSADVNP